MGKYAMKYWHLVPGWALERESSAGARKEYEKWAWA